MVGSRRAADTERAVLLLAWPPVSSRQRPGAAGRHRDVVRWVSLSEVGCTECPESPAIPTVKQGITGVACGESCNKIFTVQMDRF